MNNTKKKKQKAFLTMPEVRQYQKTRPPRTFIWGPIAVGSLGIIVGPSKSGKTTLAENLSCHIAANLKSFLGKKVNKSGVKIALALLEESLEMRSPRHIEIADSFTKEEQKLIDKNLLILNEYPGYLTTNKVWNKFCQDVEKANPEILVVDSISRLTDKKISESDVSTDVMKRLRELTNGLKLTTIVIHHTTKLYESDFPTMDNIKGSTEIIQECDYAIGLGKAAGKTCFKTIAARYCEVEEDFLLIKRTGNYRMEFDRKVTPQEAARETDGRYDNTAEESVYDTIKTLSKESEDGIIKTKSIIAASELDKRRVYEHKKTLLEKKKIIQVKKGHYKLA